MRKLLVGALLALLLVPGIAFAAPIEGHVVVACEAQAYTLGQSAQIVLLANGDLCTNAGGGGASLSAKSTAAPPSYAEGTTNPLSMNNSGELRTIVDSTQVVPTGTASALASANISVGTLPLNAAGDPYTQATLNITSATTTTIVSGSASQTVRIYAVALTCAAAQTIDVQSTGGTSRTGGALTCASSGSVVLDPFPTGSARWTSVSGEGIQFVTSTTGAIHGTVWYIKS